MYYENYVNAKKKRKLKDADITRATGITSSTLSEWKKGKYTPKADKLQAIADALDVSVEFLITGKDWNPEKLDPDLAAAAAVLSNDVTLMMIAQTAAKLNQEGREKVLAYTKDLLASGLYIFSDAASSAS